YINYIRVAIFNDILSLLKNSIYELIAFIAVALSLKITFFLPLNNSLLIVPHTPSIVPLSMQHPGRDILCFIPSFSNVTLNNLLVYCYLLSVCKSILLYSVQV